MALLVRRKCSKSTKNHHWLENNPCWWGRLLSKDQLTLLLLLAWILGTSQSFPINHIMQLNETRYLNCIFLYSTEQYNAEGNGNPLQYSCLANPTVRGAWWAAVYGVTQSRTRLKRLSSSRTVQNNAKCILIEFIQVSLFWFWWSREYFVAKSSWWPNEEFVLLRKSYFYKKPLCGTNTAEIFWW